MPVRCDNLGYAQGNFFLVLLLLSLMEIYLFGCIENGPTFQLGYHSYRSSFHMQSNNPRVGCKFQHGISTIRKGRD